MKKLFIYSLLSLAFMILFSSTVSADVIPPNSHPLDRCVKIVNLDEFTDIYLIGYITGPMVKGHEAYIYKKDECLSMGYKFNQLKVLAAKKSYIDSIGVNNLQVKKVQIPGECPGGCYSEELSDKNVFVSDEKIHPYGGYIDQGNPLIKETIEYSIAGYSNGKLILYKSKQTSEYNNGTPKKVETFSNPLEPTPAPSPELTKRGFWQSIICFFRALFGRGCQ
jgi:hypothetical protein